MSHPDALVCLAGPEDAPAICTIYNHYVLNTTVTFEETPVSDADMADRIRTTLTQLPWILAKAGPRVLGYAYAVPWRARAAYRHSVESTVYLDPTATGRGIGRLLCRSLLDRLRHHSINAVIGGIALPNPASVAMHESLGFEQVACFKEVGMKFGRWIDVGFWETRLRST